jgi:hypothetical protein
MVPDGSVIGSEGGEGRVLNRHGTKPKWAGKDFCEAKINAHFGKFHFLWS